ncbi:hypothetical protein [Streptomyces sp. enrichment culture]|uniref:hypothetical protein n=1 Tax=Streptomyces sp. enrichment culture TaxID=1795815 RepID=UPI003F54B320
MSTEREYEAEAYVPQGAGGPPGVRPNVYHPLPAPAPAYEEYADPAAAHGWQNDYDATRELPPVTGASDGPAEPAPQEPSGAGAGRAGSRRAGRGRARRRAGGRRRAVVAGGALATVAGTVAVIAVLSGTGSPDGSRPAGGGRTADAPTTRGDGTDGRNEGEGTGGEGAGDATPTTVPPASAPASATRPAAAAPSSTPTRPAAPRPDTTASGPPGVRPTTTESPAGRSAAPTATTSPTASPTYRPGGPHRGHGGPRWPR